MLRIFSALGVLCVAGGLSFAFGQGTTGGSTGITSGGFACFGVQCADDPFWDQYAPPMPGGFSTWQSYGEWRGLSVNLHFPSDTPAEECYSHCMSHARDAQQACLANAGTENGQCNATFQAVLSACSVQCAANDPH